MNMSAVKSLLSSIALAYGLSACQITEPEKVALELRPSLADLLLTTPLSASQSDFSEVDRKAKLSALYQQILSMEPDVAIRSKAEYRLVQLDTDRFDLNLDDVGEVQYQLGLERLIAQHQQLLQQYPDNLDNQHIYYQLAKLLDLQGDSLASLAVMDTLLFDFPHTDYYAEVQFRRGDFLYNQQNYQAALAAYQAVKTAENNDKYRLNSHYMAAWSWLKLGEYHKADREFIAVLDQMAHAYLEQNSLNHATDFDFTLLADSEASLAKDVQRILSISLSQQSMSRSLRRLLNDSIDVGLDIAPYQHLLTRYFAEFLIAKSLPLDAQKVYEDYVDAHQQSLWAARFSMKLLDLYALLGDKKRHWLLKQSYVNNYGFDSDLWQSSDEGVRQILLPNLTVFSHQYARRFYALAQATKAKTLRKQGFEKAASWLSRYLDFAEHDLATDERPLAQDKFLLAEASYESEQFEQALLYYQTLAYDKDLSVRAELSVQAQMSEADDLLFIDPRFVNNMGQESAYACTLTIRALLGQIDDQQSVLYRQRLVQRDRLDKAFVVHYANDPRATRIAQQAAEYAFDIHDHDNVMFYADFILEQVLAAKSDILVTNFQQGNKANKVAKLSKKQKELVKFASQSQALSLYQQDDFVSAEGYLLYALSWLNKKQDNKRWQEFRHLVASSIYAQAETSKPLEPELAIKHLLRLGQVIPESRYRIDAEFDAINLLLDSQQWQLAINELRLFAQRYPKHDYSQSIPAKLANAYEQLEDWASAAEQMLIIVKQADKGSKNNADSAELKRQAQYTAATYFEKAGNRDKALDTFRTYAHAYPEPFAVAQEVRYKMSEFYLQSMESNKQHFWHRKILSFHKKSAAKQSEDVLQRSRWLASFSAYELGRAHQQTFAYRKLRVPLNKSLKRKKKAMKQAITYYQDVLDFALADFVPKTSYQLAEIYRVLAKDIMKSQRPNGLDELALEEYDILLEEIAYPFEEKAIELHKHNAQRAWQDIYDQWVEKSFAKLAKLSPAEFDKKERLDVIFEELH